MRERDNQISLTDMLSHAHEAVGLLGSSSRDELERERIKQLALTQLVTIVGEAANRVTKESRAKYSKIPWPEIIGMRNRLVHGYDVIDLDILWDTIKIDLPPLIKMLEEILENDSD